MIPLMRKDVLDRGFVELLNLMPHPDQGISGDQVIVNAARTSYLGESKGEEADKKLLFYLMRNQHTSPFEQVEFQFRIHAPLVTLWQLVRHRTANINMQSGRYTEFEEDQFYIPDVWRLQSQSNKQMSDGELDSEGSKVLTTMLENHYKQSYEFYRIAIQQAGVSREMARLFLPGFAVYYTCIWKIDAHNLMHFLKLRLHEHAQYEIRVYAEAIWEMFKIYLPWTAEALEEYQLNAK